MSMDDKGEIAKLVALAQKGQQAAISRLIENTQDRLFKFCVYLCGNRHLAQDLCQDTYIKVLENLPKLKNGESFSSWMLVTAKNLYFDHLRAAHQRQQAWDEDFDPADDTQRPEHMERRVELKKALAQLNPEQRLILVLVDLEGYSYMEAGTVLGVSENTVRSRVYRARQELLKVLENSRNETSSSLVFPKEAVP